MKPTFLESTTVYRKLQEIASSCPSETAYIFPAEDKVCTYRQLLSDVDKAAKSLLSISVKRGDKFAILCTNTYAYVVLMFAGSAIGAVCVPLNTNYKKKEIRYSLEASDSKVLFCLKSYRKVNFETIANELDFNQTYILSSESPEIYPDFREFLSLGQNVSELDYDAARALVKPEDIFCLQFTSGTTGNPKGALLTNYSAINIGRQFAALMSVSEQDVLCTPLPLFHCFGNIDVLLSALCGKAPLVLIDYFTPKKVLAAIDIYHCTSLYAVPTMFVAMYEHPEFHKFDVSSLHKGIIGGSVCIPKVVETITKKFHMDGLAVGYGTTETCALAVASYDTDSQYSRMYTCGKVLEFMEAKIVNPETREECMENMPGELLIRGYNTMQGYYKDEEATKRVLDEDGWYHTGDMAVMEPDGLIRITGRYKDIIIRGGENISPTEIEEILLSIDGIRAAEVVGLRDEKYGEEIASFIICDENLKLSDNEIRDFVRIHLAHYKIPKYILYVNEFPKTSSGKIQKYKLVKLGEKMLGL